MRVANALSRRQVLVVRHLASRPISVSTSAYTYPSQSLHHVQHAHPVQHIQQNQHQHHQQRGYWQEIVRQRKGRDGKLKYEDPEMVVRRFQDARRADGMPLLDIYQWNDRHEKGWMRRQRLKDKKRYEFDKKHVMEMAKYIEFVNKNKDK